LSDLNAQSQKTKIWRVVCQSEKNYLTNFRKDQNKFPEIFGGKFPNSQP